MPDTALLSEVTTRNYSPETIISILRSMVAHYSNRIVKLKREKKTLLRALRRKSDVEKAREVIHGGASTATESRVLSELQVGIPSRKRRRLITPTLSKDSAAAYLEECHSFDIEQVTRDLSLTNGNIWHYLTNHHFRVHELTSLLLPCFTDNVNRDTKTVMYSHIIGLAHSFKYLRRHLSTELQWSDFKRKCAEPFQCPTTICFSSHPVSSAVDSSAAIVSTGTELVHTTPKKRPRNCSLLSNPVGTRNQKIRIMAQDARLIASQKDLEMNIWKLKYEALYHTTKSMREKTSCANCRCSVGELPNMDVVPNLTESILCTTSTSTDGADVPILVEEDVDPDVPIPIEEPNAVVSIVEESDGDVQRLIDEELYCDVSQTVVISDCSDVKFSVEHLVDHNYSELEDSKHAIPIINIIPTITCYPEDNNQAIKSEPHEMSNSLETHLQSAANSELVHNLTEGSEVDNDIQCTIHTEIVHGNDLDVGSDLVEVPGELDCKPEIVDNDDNVVILGDVNIDTSVQHNDTLE